MAMSSSEARPSPSTATSIEYAGLVERLLDFGNDLDDQDRTDAAATLEATDRKLGMAVEALHPFAKIGRHCAGEPDETVLYVHQGIMGDYPLTIGDFRKALSSIGGGE
jgi:hypothetical protein